MGLRPVVGSDESSPSTRPRITQKDKVGCVMTKWKNPYLDLSKMDTSLLSSPPRCLQLQLIN